jgi:TPR repeat protein
MGKGVPQDYVQATARYQKAADSGSYQAQCNLGFMYNNGLGVKQNYAEAYYWFAIAADGEPDSGKQKEIIKLRDGAASHLPPAVLIREQKRVSEWSEGGD